MHPFKYIYPLPLVYRPKGVLLVVYQLGYQGHLFTRKCYVVRERSRTVHKQLSLKFLFELTLAKFYFKNTNFARFIGSYSVIIRRSTIRFQQ